MKHALPESVRRFPWPSVQRDSELLAERCRPGLRLLDLRERLAFMFEQIGKVA